MTELSARHWQLRGLVFTIAVLAHWPAVRGGFVLDDQQLLVNNPYLTEFEGLLSLLQSEFFAASGEVQNVPYYRPVSGAIYWLSYQLLGARSDQQHALNLGLHGLVAALLLSAVLRATRGRRALASFAAVALFAIHPATAEIVAYIGGRQDMVGWCIVVAAWTALTPGDGSDPRPMTGTLALGATVAAALTREYFLCAPALLLSGVVARRSDPRHGALSVLAGGSLAIASVLTLRHTLGVQGFGADSSPWLATLSAVSGVWCRLTKLMIWPHDLSVEVSLVALSPVTAVLVGAMALIATTGAIAMARRARDRLSLVLLGAGILWTVTLLHAPVVVKYGYFADRYAYGGLIALTVWLCALFQALPSALARYRTVSVCLGGFAALAIIPFTWARDVQWRSEASLQRAMFTNRPDDPQSQFAEGMRRFHLEDYEGAYPLCLAYQKARPLSLRAGLCLGTTLLRRNQPREAAAALRPYALSRPGNLRARATLFQAWFLANDLQAIEEGLKFYRAYFPNAGDLDAAEAEVKRRMSEAPL